MKTFYRTNRNGAKWKTAKMNNHRVDSEKAKSNPKWELWGQNGAIPSDFLNDDGG